MSDILEVIKTRRSVRKYKSDMVPAEIIDKIIEAGTYAATGMDRQSPIILAVTDKELRDKLFNIAALTLGTVMFLPKEENEILDESDVLIDKAAGFDNGFRVLKLDTTNMEDVYYSAQEYSQQMLQNMASNIKRDRTDLDLLFGCLLDWGLPLSMPYHSEQMEGCTVHTYNEGDLIACFDENVPESVVREIARRKPLRAVFRDSSFATSPEKINVGEIFKLLAPDTRVKVI